MKWILLTASLVALGSCSPKESNELLTTTPGKPEAAAAGVAPPAAPPAMKSAAPVSADAPAPSIEGLPAGNYTLDPAHSTLFFKISHMGFSNFTGWFDKFSADIKLDPANPGMASVTATVDPASLMVHAPPKGFEEELRADKFLDAKKFNQIGFKSTSVTVKTPNTAAITGDLTLHGVTKPITLEATFNGGYAGNVYEPRARIGFSATGKFNRSDFGIAGGIPQPGSNMGTSDNIDVVIEAEFLGPPWKDASAANPPTKPN